MSDNDSDSDLLSDKKKKFTIRNHHELSISNDERERSPIPLMKEYRSFSLPFRVEIQSNTSNIIETHSVPSNNIEIQWTKKEIEHTF